MRTSLLLTGAVALCCLTGAGCTTAIEKSHATVEKGHTTAGKGQTTGEKDHRAELLGTWQLVSISIDGKKYPENDQEKEPTVVEFKMGRKLAIPGYTMTVTEGQISFAQDGYLDGIAGYKLDTSQTPKHLNAAWGRYIYKLDGATLIIGYAGQGPRPEGPHPADFGVATVI